MPLECIVAALLKQNCGFLVVGTKYVYALGSFILSPSTMTAIRNSRAGKFYIVCITGFGIIVPIFYIIIMLVNRTTAFKRHFR